MTFEERFQRLQLSFSWNAKAREQFYLLMSDFVKDGVPVFDALEEISQRWVDTKNSKSVVTQALLKEMRGGGTTGESLRLGQALPAWAPSMESIAIDAGEQAGDIANGLRMAAGLTNVKSKVNKTITGKMIYPMILLMLFCAVLVGIRSQILPVLGDIVPREMWPAGPAALGRLADSVGLVITLMVGTLVSIGGLYALTRERAAGHVRSWVDTHIFPWTLNRSIGGAVILTCFAALMRAGVPLSEIIARMSVAASDWERSHLALMRMRLRQGSLEGDAMATHLFDSDPQWILRVYGKLSSFSDALQGLSEKQIEDLLNKISNTMTLIQTLCMVGITLLIVWVLYSFMAISLLAKTMGTS